MQKGKLNPEIFRIHADFCRVLCNATRIMIICLLAEGEKSVSELADILERPIPNVSQHLRVMRDKSAVVSRKEGQNVYYKIANNKFIQGCALIREGIIEQLNLRHEKISGT